MLKSFRNIKEILDPARPTNGPRCGEWLYIVAKVQAGLPLSIVERDLAADALRQQWLTRKEYTAYQRWRTTRRQKGLPTTACPAANARTGFRAFTARVKKL